MFIRFLRALVGLGILSLAGFLSGPVTARDLAEDFRQPPPTARPWVYYFFINGNISRAGITADLTALQQAGIGGFILMEVDVGVPAGPVNFMGPEWRALFKHTVLEAERLGLQMCVNVGPGWTGSGGPWVPVEQSMQHLVSATTNLTGGRRFEGSLPVPAPHPPFFGRIPDALESARTNYYRDIAVVAFPADAPQEKVGDLVEKGLFERAPFSSQPGVKPYLASDFAAPGAAGVPRGTMVNLTAHLQSDGRLVWDAPAGHWCVMRFGLRTTGANTRPAPPPGIGFECDKFDRAAVAAHFDQFVGSLLREIGPRPLNRQAGWTMIHLDSWEMGAQNWTANFQAEFRQRRGYDTLPWLPALAGRVVENAADSERFLWDLRQTAQELVVENYAGYTKELGRAHGFKMSIEPYDMNPCSDLSLGGVADFPMAEFWAEGLGFNAAYSCLEAISIAHTLGRPVVPAEAFTSVVGEGFRLHPGAMKAQADWAFCLGINRLVFHRYAHQPWLNRAPGMTMGPYGVHYERTQTWWDMAGAWHQYLARCQALLQRGQPVADILYLAPEGAPLVWQPPPSALQGTAFLPDRKGYNFAGCAPETLRPAIVKNGQIVLASGAVFRVLVLPESGVMTTPLLAKVRDLVRAGATVIGPPVTESPSLSPALKTGSHPALVRELWGDDLASVKPRRIGLGQVVPTDAQRWREAWSGLPQKPPQLPAPARWIWYPEGQPASSAPVGKRLFRRTFSLPAGAAVASACLMITADNSFAARLNGHMIGEGDNFTVLYEFPAEPALRPGMNELVVMAANGGDGPNPAGLIAALQIQFHNGESLVIATDDAWESFPEDRGDTPAKPALVLGAAGMSPWQKLGQGRAAKSYPSLYGDYATVAQVLGGLGVPPDFAADAPLRYTHRRDGGAEIYFVSNPAQTSVTASCRFRVAGKKPELWNPLTGGQQRVEKYQARGGGTELILNLGPGESQFVIFQKSWTSPRPAPVPERLKLDAQIGGPWKVRFQPGRGAPEFIELRQLIDLSTHADPAVKHFSGQATYETVLHWDPPWPKAQAQLDLGQVAVMARVRINGQEAAVAWQAPYAVDLTKLLKRGENRIEITVANLWVNRLIGDELLPADAEWHGGGNLKAWPKWILEGQPSPSGRISFASWRHWNKNSPLPPSGLIGPVVLRVR